MPFGLEEQELPIDVRNYRELTLMMENSIPTDLELDLVSVSVNWLQNSPSNEEIRQQVKTTMCSGVQVEIIVKRMYVEAIKKLCTTVTIIRKQHFDIELQRLTYFNDYLNNIKGQFYMCDLSLATDFLKAKV